MENSKKPVQDAPVEKSESSSNQSLPENNKQTLQKSQKSKKQKYVDDGHTVYNMDGVQSPFAAFKKKEDKEGLSRAEKRAAIKAAFQVYLPVVLSSIACFVVVGVLMYLWLRK